MVFYTTLMYYKNSLPNVTFMNISCKGQISAISLYFKVYSYGYITVFFIFYTSETYGLMAALYSRKKILHFF